MTDITPTEHAEQVMLFTWARFNEGRFPELRLLYAVPNWAGVKGPREGARRKAEGVRAGVPDVHLPVARGGYLSLYIEMKRLKPRITKTKGVTYTATKQTKEQVEWMDRLSAAGNLVAVCCTAQEAQATVLAYLRGELVRS